MRREILRQLRDARDAGAADGGKAVRDDERAQGGLLGDATTSNVCLFYVEDVNGPHSNPALHAARALRGFALRMAATHLLPVEVMFLRGPATRKQVALTFDDGPHELTNEYLTVLDRARARATFFLVGRACTERPAAVEAIAQAGHEIAGHGFTHTEFPQLGSDALRSELDRTAALLPPPPAGRALVRPPRGVVTPRSLLACFRAGYTSAMWSFDTLDWSATRAEDVLARIEGQRIEAGEIILMHEGRGTTLEALPRVLARLQGDGFELVTVGELMREARAQKKRYPLFRANGANRD
jgi:peptidoglycan/xylan/chitin deacetylase (PgdA/CDA1 family)